MYIFIISTLVILGLCQYLILKTRFTPYQSYLLTSAIYLGYISLHGWSTTYHRFKPFSTDPIWDKSPHFRVHQFTEPSVIDTVMRCFCYEIFEASNQIYFGKLGPSMVLHHMMSFLALIVAINVIYNHYIVCYMTGPLFLSSTFLSLRDENLPTRGVAMDAGFALSYIVVRLIMGTPILARCTYDMYSSPGKSIVDHFLVFVTAAFIALNWFWGWKIVKKIARMFGIRI